MDEQQLIRIDRALGAYPAAWDADESLAYEALAVAAAKEALGEPVELNDPQVAAFLSLNPRAVAIYADLVWVEEQELADIAELAAAAPESVTAPLIRSATEWLRRNIVEIQAVFTPLRLDYGGATRGATLTPDPDQQRGSVALRGQRLSVAVTLKVRDERGSIYLQLVPTAGSQRPSLRGAEAALFEAVQSGPLVAGGAARAFSELERGDVYFSGLDPERGYVIAIAIPDEELIVVVIAPSEWPE